MRGTIPGLATPFPVVRRLPSLYQDDDLTCRFTAGLDEVLAPVLSTLDNLWAYFDPRLCPPDLLPWLASWVGVELPADLPEPVRRELVATAGGWQRGRGTAAALAEQLRRLTGAVVEVADDGGTTWSTAPGAPVRPCGPGVVRVVVRGDADRERVLAVAREAVPAHVPVRVDVRTDAGGLGAATAPSGHGGGS